MKVAHIVPPLWEGALGRGRYRMTFVPWVLEYETYALNLRRHLGSYVILDHNTFEDDLRLPEPSSIALAGDLIDPDEVVLPDVLGNWEETLAASRNALQVVPAEVQIMFVPQARTMGDWTDCLHFFLRSAGASRSITIGLSSLRRPESLRAQIGTRIPMMELLSREGFEMHILGLSSVRHFVEEELPAAREFGVRGLDTCAAFALGARGLELTGQSPRLFLGDIEKYKSLPDVSVPLIRANMQTLEAWVEGE